MLDRKNLGLLILLLFLIAVTAGIIHTAQSKGVFSPKTADEPTVSPTPFVEVADLNQQVNVEVIFDVSNSMWERVKGVNKILNSRDLMNVILKDLPGNVNVGLRTFGGDGESRLEVAIGTHNRDKIREIIDQMRPSGQSPIGYALELAGKDLLKMEGKNYILLISDGIDTGKVDPIKKARELRDSGIITHVVYMESNDGKGREELTRVAEEGGGHFYTFNERDLVVPTMTLTH